MRLVPGLYPSNTGWTFPDPDTGVVLRAGNFKELVDALVAYRAANGLEPRAPGDEVLAHICANNPLVCRGIRGTLRVTQPVSKDKSLLERSLEWVRRLAPDRPPVPRGEAAQRVEACRRCSLNVKAPGCLACRAAALVAVRQATKAGSGVSTRGLKVCSKYAWFNAVAVSRSDIPTDAGAPQGCWRQPSA